MSYNPRADFASLVELSETGIDANAATTTASLDLGHAKTVCFHVVANTGTHATHVISLQVSLDNVNWTTTGQTVSGAGLKDNLEGELATVNMNIRETETTLVALNQAKVGIESSLAEFPPDPEPLDPRPPDPLA